MIKLTRYWFQFDKPPNEINGVIIGGYIWAAGVTAYDLNDAKQLLKKTIFEERDIPWNFEVIENIDVGTLDAAHVLPNIYQPPSNRGVWFPCVSR